MLMNVTLIKKTYLSNRKLNKANDMLSKIRHVLDINTLRSVYCAIFESHLCYVWARNIAIDSLALGTKH